MKLGSRVSIAVPVATMRRLDERWGPNNGTLRERMRRGIERIDALATGDFDAVRKDRAAYATGWAHREPHRSR